MTMTPNPQNHEKNWSIAVSEAETYSILSKPEYVAIFDILSRAKENGKHLTFKDLQSQIEARYGDFMTERKTRYHLNKLINEEAITILDKKLYMKDDYNTRRFIPQTQLNIFIFSIALSGAVLVYDAYNPNPTARYSALTTITLVIVLVISNYLDHNFTLDDYKEHFRSKFSHKKSEPISD